jgi:hypothetical protein
MVLSSAPASHAPRGRLRLTGRLFIAVLAVVAVAGTAVPAVAHAAAPRSTATPVAVRPPIFDPVTEAEGAPWNGAAWTMARQGGMGSFALDRGARELRTSGRPGEGLLAISAHPAVASFRWTAPLRLDSAGEKSVKLHFWGDGRPAVGAASSMGSSFFVDVQDHRIRLRHSSASTRQFGATLTEQRTGRTAITIDVEANSATGRVQVWAHPGAARPARPGIDTVLPQGLGRFGRFGIGLLAGRKSVVHQAAIHPMTVAGLAAPAAPVPPTAVRSPAVAASQARPPARAAGSSVPASGTWEPLGPREIVFGAASEWKRDIRTAPVAGNSPALVSNLARQVSEVYGGWAASNIYRFNTSYHVVGPGVRRITVKFFDCQNKGYTPAELYTPPPAPSSPTSRSPTTRRSRPAPTPRSPSTTRPATSSGSSGRPRSAPTAGTPAGAAASTRSPRTRASTPA